MCLKRPATTAVKFITRAEEQDNYKGNFKKNIIPFISFSGVF